MYIAMIGSGYVGLVSGACLADFGHNVTCVDISPDKITKLQAGLIPMYEPGLEQLVATNARAKRLHFTTDLAAAVKGADVVFIAVGTPSREGDGEADLAHVHAAAAETARAVSGFTVVAMKSTVPVGTGDAVERIMRAANPAADIAVVSNPEFLREGAAIKDFKLPDRIVVGLEDERARAVMAEVYRPLYLNTAPVMFTRRRTAEVIKYAANGFLAMKITYINEIADLCEKVGANVQEVARGIGLDNRIGGKFLNAGPGFGGSCLPKDTLALAQTARSHESPLRLIETTIDVNRQRKRRMGERVIAACGGNVTGKTIAILGLTFKPNTDDMREAASIDIIAALQAQGASIRAHDPEGMANARAHLSDVHYAGDPYEAAEGASATVIITEWESFRALDLSRLRSAMAEPVLVDLRNIYRRDDVERHGLNYVSIGRP
jgi:UDPglucose 6-dehydrogenase